MERIAQCKPFENEISSTTDAFFRSFGIGRILRKAGACKSKGIPAVTVFQKLFTLAFSHRTLFMELETDKCPNIAKDAFYRFLNSCHINWMRFTTFLERRYYLSSHEADAEKIEQTIESLVER